MSVDTVKEGAVVTLGYTLRLANGEIADYSEADDPLEYLHGAENIIPGLERSLLGLKVGDKKKVEVPPADGYGEYDNEEVEVVPRTELPKGTPPLQLGMMLLLTDDDGNFAEAYVREIGPKTVTLDFNHPLAGQTLFFDVEILGIREATEEEIEHGHVHGEDGEFDEDFDDDDEDFEDFEDFDEDDEDFEDEEFEDDEEEDDAPKGKR